MQASLATNLLLRSPAVSRVCNSWTKSRRITTVPYRCTQTRTMPPSTAARLLPLPHEGLPGWCDRFLDPPGCGDLFASRLWYDVTLAHALPAEVEPMLASTDTVMLPLLRVGGRLRGLTTDYSLAWRPLIVPDAGAPALREAGRSLGRLLRFGPPVLLDALDPAAPGLEPLLEGLRMARLFPARFTHFGNWYEAFPPDLGWTAYLADRPPALRNTINRKLARAARELCLERIATPGPALEAGIAAYEDVRARSWKPWEPFPDFDGALMRALAAQRALRLGVLRETRAGNRPVAAQYWALDRGGAGGRARALLLKLAHAEESRATSPGTALTAMMIRALIEEDGVRELDFGRGDDPYKRLWVSHRRQRVGYVLADPLHPAGLFALARQVASRARHRMLAGLGRGRSAEPA